MPVIQHLVRQRDVVFHICKAQRTAYFTGFLCQRSSPLVVSYHKLLPNRGSRWASSLKPNPIAADAGYGNYLDPLLLSNHEVPQVGKFNSSGTTSSQKDRISSPEEQTDAKSDTGSVPPTVSKLMLRNLLISSMVPMFGFGLMDNIIMIQAGEMIDMTLGVTFGLSTLTAAAFGQIFSDVSGVCFGTTMQSIALKFGLAPVHLTADQRSLRVVRLVANLGRILGVILGCLLGMTSLLLLDLDKTDLKKREAEISPIFSAISHQAERILNSRCAIYLLDNMNQLYSVNHHQASPNSQDGTACRDKERIDLFLPNDASNPQVVARVARTGQPITLKADTKGSLLCYPVFDYDDPTKVIAVIELSDKRTASGATYFKREDERLVKMLSEHISLYMALVAKKRHEEHEDFEAVSSLGWVCPDAPIGTLMPSDQCQASSVA